MRKQLLAIGLATALVANCAGVSTTHPTSAASAIDKKPQFATRIFLQPTCPVATKPELGALAAGLLSLFLKPIVQAAISGLGDMIKKAGADKQVVESGFETGHFYSIARSSDIATPTSVSPNFQCVTVIYGQLSGPDKVAEAKAFTENFGIEKDISTFLSPMDSAANAYIFGGDIRLYIQYSIKYSDDRTAMRLLPGRALISRKLLAEGSPGASPANPDLVLVLSFRRPSQTGEGEIFAVGTTKLSGLPRGKLIESQDLDALSTGWMPLAPMPEAVTALIAAHDKRVADLDGFKKALEGLKNPKPGPNGKSAPVDKDAPAKIQSAQASIDSLTAVLRSDADHLGLAAPVTVAASITETLKGSDFLVKLGTYLSANSAGIAQPIADQLDPSKREAAKATALDNEDTLRTAAIQAASDYDAEAAKTGAALDPAKVRIDEIKVGQACRKLRAAGYDDIACLAH